MKKMKQCLIEEDKLKNSALGNGGNFYIIYFQFERQKTKAHFIMEIYIPSTVLIKAVAWATTISCRYIRALGRDKGWVLQLR